MYKLIFTYLNKIQLENEDYIGILNRNSHKLEFWFFTWILLFKDIITIKNCTDIHLLK